MKSLFQDRNSHELSSDSILYSSRPNRSLPTSGIIRIDCFLGKNATTWRVSNRDRQQRPRSHCLGSREDDWLCSRYFRRYLSSYDLGCCHSSRLSRGRIGSEVSRDYFKSSPNESSRTSLPDDHLSAAFIRADRFPIELQYHYGDVRSLS